jgi:aspartate carbamoyltransferase catalytic subunit
MPDYVLADLTAAGVPFSAHTSLDAAVLAGTDVLYVTRVQKERFADPAEYEALKERSRRRSTATRAPRTSGR